MSEREIDETTGVQTTGHDWDGIKELDNPMPRWWLWTFYATIVFAIGYVIYYPAIPLIEGSTMGVSGETNRSSLSGAAGGEGYPNLNDDDWLWGGDLDAIYTSINHGIRNDEDEDTRDSQMPAFGTDEILEKEEIRSVVEYVLQVSGQEHKAESAVLGAEIFSDNCAACHGENAQGGREVGAPNLKDAISLYGNTRETLYNQIVQPKHGVMPPWGKRLGDVTVKQLAIYVHSLGGGERTASQ